MKKFSLLIVAIAFYVLTVNLSVSTGLILIGIFVIICTLFWIVSNSNLLRIISSATTGKPMETSNTQVLVVIAGLVGGFIGIVVANPDFQSFLTDMFTP